jgi:hypothetical protein
MELGFCREALESRLRDIVVWLAFLAERELWHLKRFSLHGNYTPYPPYTSWPDLGQKPIDGQLPLSTDVDLSVGNGRHGELHGWAGGIPRPGQVALVKLSANIGGVPGMQNRWRG